MPATAVRSCVWLQVMGIPQLVVLAPDSTVLSSNARSAVTADPNGQNFPWQGSAHAEPRWVALALRPMMLCVCCSSGENCAVLCFLLCPCSAHGGPSLSARDQSPIFTYCALYPTRAGSAV